jgi:hypothetical protein
MNDIIDFPMAATPSSVRALPAIRRQPEGMQLVEDESWAVVDPVFLSNFSMSSGNH